MAKDTNKGLLSWALYDWANSAYFVMIQTFVFAVYFSQSVAENETEGTALWGNIIGIAGLAIALSAPILGSIADEGGRRKPWIFFFTALSVTGCCVLWLVEPESQFVILALCLVFVTTVSAELSLIFYNAMLPDLATDQTMGRWSGWAWGLGYIGGLACLILCYFLFIEMGADLFGLDTSRAEEVRITFVVTGIWYGLFSLPFFFYTADTPSKKKKWQTAVSDGFQRMKDGWRLLKNEKNISRFLIARLFYNDGLATIFAMGGVYAAGTFQFDTTDIFYFGIGLNITAGIGAYSFAWIDDRMGSKETIVLALLGVIIPVVAVVFVQSVTWFWVWGLLLGVFVGPVQAASRTFMGRIAPKEIRNQMFGLFALSGKVTTFAGPILVGWITYLMGSQRWGMSIILLLLIIGLLLMLSVENDVNADAIVKTG